MIKICSNKAFSKLSQSICTFKVATTKPYLVDMNPLFQYHNILLTCTIVTVID